MRLYSLFVFCLFVVNGKMNAQKQQLGKVTIAELEEKFSPTDPNAPAAILFKKGRTYFTYDYKNGFTANHTYEFKLKIYNSTGLKWADQKVRYYIGYENLDDDRLAFSDAVTYNLENGKIVKTKLDNDGNFKNKVNKYWKEKAITLPNVKAGSIIEYSYTLKSLNLVRFPDFEIQYDIPVNYFEYTTEIPEVYVYKTLSIGKCAVESDAKIANGSQSFTDEHNQTQILSYKQINTVYAGKDILSLIDEPFLDNRDNYKGSIQHELERIRYTDKPDKDYSKTWEGVATMIFKNDNFGKELEKNSFLLDDVRRLLTNVNSQDERLEIIFKFVQNKMNWNDVNDYYTDKGVEQSYADQTGNVAEINFILMSMLKLGGIEVNPVLVSTIENGVPVYPTRTGFNYVIAAAEIDGKQILLDASHKYTSPNILPLNVLNWKGRLIKKDGSSSEIDLMPVYSSKKNSNILAKIDASGNIEGKMRTVRSDYEAYKFRIQNASKNEGNYLGNLEQQFGDIKITDYNIVNKFTTLSDPVIETFAFAATGQTEHIGDKIYLNPLLFFTQIKNPLNQETRRYPIYFGYPTQEKNSLNLQVPNGYKVESFPSPIHIISEDNDIAYSLNISLVDNIIQIICTKEINRSVFSALNYDGLKSLFQKVIASQNEKIVLKRI